MKMRYWIGVLIMLSVALYLWKVDFFTEKSPVYIALSGPLTGKADINGKAMIQGAQMYLDKINQQGGINGSPVKLLPFDDQNQAQLAKKTATEIAQHSEAVAVIGHYSSVTSLAAAPIYQQQGIAVVSGSATTDELTQNNDWYFRTTFNNSDQAALLANYVRKVLDYHYADIIFDDDVYGTTLANTFHDTADTVGLKVRNRWHFSDDQSFQTSLENMIATLKKQPIEKSVLLFATHSSEAVKAIVELRRQGIGKNIQFIGADALASGNFKQKMAAYPREQAQPGYYSEGTYITAPFLFDIASQYAQQFRREFVQKYTDEPSITAVLYYDAAKLIVHALQKSEANSSLLTLRQKRQQIKTELSKLSKLEDAVEGVTGDLYFDKNGDAIKSIPMGIYKNGAPIVAEYQYQLLSSVQNNPHLLADVLDNQIVQVNGKYMNRARVVYAGIDFNEINNLNFANSLYSANFFVWFRFKGDFDDQNIEFLNASNDDVQLGKPIAQQSFLGGEMVAAPSVMMNAAIEQVMAKGTQNTSSISANNQVGQLVAEQFHNGVTARSYRIKTAFKAEFDFHDYPLDKQILPIAFRHKKLTRDNLIYVVDEQGMGLEQFRPENIEKSSQSFFNLGGWTVRHIDFFQTSHSNDSTLGMPNLFEEKQRIEYSQFNVAITIERHVINFILKTLLPIVFLIVLGYFSFFMTCFREKLAIGINFILATSLFHLKLSSDLANIGYIILIEYFFYLVYLLAMLVIINALFYHLTDDKTDSKSLRTRHLANLIGKIIYPVVLIIGTVAIIYS